MTELNLIQLQYECDNWKRLLSFISDENINLKRKLLEVLNNGFKRDLLNEFEDFQSRFVKEDERISLLRHDQAELDKLLTREIYEDGAILKKVESKIKKMRNNIRNAEIQFGLLKSSFNSYLFEKFSED